MKLKLLSLLFVLAIAFGVKAQWSEIINGANGPSPIQMFELLKTDSKGNLYAGGTFPKATVYIWDKNSWNTLGGNNYPHSCNYINTFCVDDSDNLFAVWCTYTNMGNFFNNIVKWNGSKWSTLGDSTTSPYISSSQNISICKDKFGNLYTSGEDYINGKNYWVVKKWDGNNWSILGNSLNLFNYPILNICTDNIGNIYAAGVFTNLTAYPNGNTYVSKWDKFTNKWSELGGANSFPINSSIKVSEISTLCVDNHNNVYAAGNLIDSLGKYYVAKWDGQSWSKISGLDTSSKNGSKGIFSIYIDNKEQLYSTGSFYDKKGKYYVAKWDGNKWNELGGTNGLVANGYINTITGDSNGNIYAAGYFKNNIGKLYVAKYNTPLSPSLYIDKIDTTTCAVFVDIPVRGKSLYDISKLKGSIHWDTTYLNLGGIKFDSIYLKMNFIQIDVTHAANGYLTYNWSDSIGHTVADSAPLFTMVMYPKPNVSGGTGIWFDSIPNKLEIDTVINVAAKNASFNNGWVILSDTPQIIQSVNLLTCSAGCLPMHYQWYVNGQPIQFDTLNYIYPTTNGVYTCVVTYRTGVSISSPPVNVVLPVTLLSFKVQGFKSYNSINWQTATEINTSHFNIQRSTNGKDFTTIGKVPAKGASEYSYQNALTTDDSRFTKFYYRLQIVDKDGALSYSEVRELSIVNSSFSITPNPAKDNVTISGTKLKQVKLLDNLGRVVVVKEVINSNNISIPVTHLAKGIYMVQATFKDGSVKTEKVVVE